MRTIEPTGKGAEPPSLPHVIMIYMPRALKLAVVLILVGLMPMRAVAGLTIGFCASGHQDRVVPAHATAHGHEAGEHAQHHGDESPSQPAESSCNVCAEHCSSAAFAPAMDAALAAQPVRWEPIDVAASHPAAVFPDQLDRPPLA